MKANSKMPKAIAICHQNLEDVTEKEIFEKISIKAEKFVGKGVVIFEADMEKILEYCYTGQSIYKVLLYLSHEKIKNYHDLSKLSLSLPNDYSKSKTFIVRCKRIGEHNFSSKEIEAELAKNIDLKVDFNSPDVIIYAYIVNDDIYLGIDLAGFDLSKREYKVFSANDSIKPNIAYALAHHYKKGMKMLDPFCSDGTIIIEAALKESKFSPHFFNKSKFAFTKFFDFDFEKIDKKRENNALDIIGYDPRLNVMKYAQKNAKLSGINKLIKISKLDVEWLDIKVNQKSVDLILTYLPFVSKINDDKKIKKIYENFFYNAEYIIKTNGRIICLARNPGLVMEQAYKYGFSASEMNKFHTGDINFTIIELIKNR